MSIGIIDYGVGNIGSLSNAVYSQGWDPILISSPENFKDISHLIIPGVGSYSSAMQMLSERKLYDLIVNFVEQGKPVLGICLGMQLLSDFGSEGGKSSGFGFIPGQALPLKKLEGLNLPHVGWNEVVHIKNHPILEGIKSNIDFYFVNGYFFNLDDDGVVIALTEYGQRFPSIIAKNNIVGVQFHPEKSQKNGLRMLDNFCLWDGVC